MEFDKYKERGGYHWIEYEQKTVYGMHARKVKKWVNDGKTLDVGAGDGLITSLLNCEGIDNNKIAVKLAKDKGVNVRNCDIYNLDYDEDTFDNIFMGDVIEHLEFPDIAINNIKKILKNNGLLYIVTPPKIGETLHDKYHFKEYSPIELIEFLKPFDFEIIGGIEIIEEYIRMYAVFKNIKK